MVNRWLRILSLWAAALLVSLTAWAQSSTTGIIEGRVRDQAGSAIEGATVTGVANRSPSGAVTDSQGRYTLANLPPGIYRVRAEAPGKSAVVLDEIVVSIGTRSRVDITLVAGQTETVTVTAQAPVVDTKSVTTGGTFKVEKFIDQLPVGRNLASTLSLAPGVESGGSPQMKSNYSMSGSSGLENSYIVDGVNITNTGYGGIGSFNTIYGSLGTGVTYDFLEEVQVKTGGIDVEYGQATGGVVNTVVKTGSNDLSGMVGLFASAPVDEYKQASFFVGAVNQQKGSWNDNGSYDLGLSIGGPMVKDKLFYFVAYNPVQTKTSSTIENIKLPLSLATVDAYPSALAGLQTQKRSSNNYAAKFTWYASPNHRIELSAFGDPSKGDTGPQRFSLRNIDFPQGGGLSSIQYGANNYTLKYDAVFTPTFFMQAQVGEHSGKFDETSALNKSRYTDQRQLRCFLSPRFCDASQLADPNGRDNAATWAYGGVGFISNSKDKNDQAKVVLTWVRGNNELKGGVSYDLIKYQDHQDYTGDNVPIKFRRHASTAAETATALANPCASDGSTTTPCYVMLDTRGGVVATERQDSAGVPFWLTSRGRFNPNPGPTQTDDYALFLQDTFTFAQNWTLKAGARASQQKIQGEGVYTLQYYYDDGLRTPETTAPPADPGVYKFEWAIAPRVGLTWDTKGDGRSKLYANAARYYTRVPNDLAVRSLSNEAGLGPVNYNGWDIVTGKPIPSSQSSRGRISGGQTSVQDGTKLPFVDEYVLGYQQELGRDVSFELRGIYREQGRALEDTQFNSVEATENYYAYAFFPGTRDRDPFPAFPETGFGNYVLANPGENTPAGFPKAVRKYYALELILNKRFSDHWQFYGNMRFASLRGNYEGLFRNDNGQSDPNISSLFDFPDSPLLAGQFEPGPLNTDRPYSLKLYGNHLWDNGLNLGASLGWSAGTPRTPLLAHPNLFYQNSGELPGFNPTYWWYTTTGCVGYTECFTTGSANTFFADTGAVIPAAAPAQYSFPHLYSYTVAPRGSSGRTSDEATLDLSLSWSKQFNRWATFGVGVTVFNVFNSRETTGFDDNVELLAGVTDPDYLKPSTFQAPRSLRVLAKWNF